MGALAPSMMHLEAPLLLSLATLLATLMWMSINMIGPWMRIGSSKKRHYVKE